MSQYLVLSHIDIQNANSIAGLTWGFPAISHFLGFTHALNRKLSSHYGGGYDTKLTGCAVISHDFEQHVNSQDGGNSFRFTQRKFSYTFAPKKKDGKQIPPSIIEEGKMNLTVSLVIELNKPLVLTTEGIDKLQRNFLSMCYQMRLAGGTILNIKQAKLLSASTQEQHIAMLRKIKRLTMPGFVLLDRSEYLQNHYHGLLARHKADENVSDAPQLLDAWLDFAALKSKAIPHLSEDQSEPDENTPADWEYVAKPNPGYLVPLMTGYKAISELYDAGSVLNTRDEITPSRFVEAIHSIGEWKGIHRLEGVHDVIWRYQHDDQWYLCKQSCNSANNEVVDPQNLEAQQNQTLNFNEALNLF